MIARDTTTKAEMALARGVLYRLCAHAFRHPGAGWLEEWKEIARGGGAGLEVLALSGHAGAELHDAFDLAFAAGCDVEAVRVRHAHLIGHSPRAGATPYETEWTGAAGELLQYHQLADLAGFYRAFGLELASDCDERADHLSIELCFLEFLCVKEAYAEERGLADLAALTREAQQKFLDEHLLRWAGACCARLREDDLGGFYGYAARLLALFLEAERGRFLLASPEGPQALTESSLRLEDCCVGCDRARSCAGPESFVRESARDGV
jgi:TorA maturation chaperone TorD